MQGAPAKEQDGLSKIGVGGVGGSVAVDMNNKADEGGGDIGGGKRMAGEAGSLSGALYVSVKEEWEPNGFEVT